jgi:hypothetical protein
MSGIKDQENIEEMRKRLYDRTFTPDPSRSEGHSLTKTTVDVSRGWGEPRLVERPQPVVDIAEKAAVVVEEVLEKQKVEEEEESTVPKKRPYRIIIMLASVILFVVAAAVSSVYLFFGANQISGRNISLDVSAPFTIAAGEVYAMEVSIANQNSVPIESATLIVNYPSGTKTADENAKDIFEARIPVVKVDPGEAIKVPVTALLFGEENEEKEVKTSIEYRVTGSNGTFFKEAEPIKVKINSSPLVIRVTSVEKVSSGQEMEITLHVRSNAPAVQRNVLVSANYPNSFSFVSSEPEPAYNENEWLIAEILPEETKVIKLKGKVSGVSDEQAELQFEAGTPRSDNQFIMGSVLTKTKTSYVIERPFIDVVASINRDKDGEAVIEAGKVADVIVVVVNTLDETIYDMRIEVTPKGNLIRDSLLDVPAGFYDSNTKTISFEVSGMPSLAEVRPGEKREVHFSVNPDEGQSTGSFDISTNVYARRVNEASAEEELVGTTVAEAKYDSAVANRSQVSHSGGDFLDDGPIPPEAGVVTTYTLTFEVESGVNDLTNAVLTTTIPQYVNWLDVYKGDGAIEYNPVAKQLRWNIGAMEAGTKQQLEVQVGLLPSVTQVGKTPTIVGAQEFRATDRFTNSTLKSTAPALTSEISVEAGFSKGNGTVVAGN